MRVRIHKTADHEWTVELRVLVMNKKGAGMHKHHVHKTATMSTYEGALYVATIYRQGLVP